jgi:tRNA(fMet)-specific endonuclease VapC
MRYLVDTNTWIFYLKHSDSPVEARSKQTPAADVVVCSVVWAELLHGARKYGKREERVARIERTLGPYRSLPLDDAAARHYADIRDDLESRGALIGPYDLLIASIALSNKLALVTNDGDFMRVKGLTVEDWTLSVSGAPPAVA